MIVVPLIWEQPRSSRNDLLAIFLSWTNYISVPGRGAEGVGSIMTVDTANWCLKYHGCIAATVQIRVPEVPQSLRLDEKSGMNLHVELELILFGLRSAG